MRRYFFYESQVSGVVFLQNPATADNNGIAQANKIYAVKVVPDNGTNTTKRNALLAAISAGQLDTEAQLITAITTALTAAKIVLEDNNKNVVYGLN